MCLTCGSSAGARPDAGGRGCGTILCGGLSVRGSTPEGVVAMTESWGVVGASVAAAAAACRSSMAPTLPRGSRAPPGAPPASHTSVAEEPPDGSRGVVSCDAWPWSGMAVGPAAASEASCGMAGTGGIGGGVTGPGSGAVGVCGTTGVCDPGETGAGVPPGERLLLRLG